MAPPSLTIDYSPVGHLSDLKRGEALVNLTFNDLIGHTEDLSVNMFCVSRAVEETPVGGVAKRVDLVDKTSEVSGRYTASFGFTDDDLSKLAPAATGAQFIRLYYEVQPTSNGYSGASIVAEGYEDINVENLNKLIVPTYDVGTVVPGDNSLTIYIVINNPEGLDVDSLSNTSMYGNAGPSRYSGPIGLSAVNKLTSAEATTAGYEGRTVLQIITQSKELDENNQPVLDNSVTIEFFIRLPIANTNGLLKTLISDVETLSHATPSNFLNSGGFEIIKPGTEQRTADVTVSFLDSDALRHVKVDKATLTITVGEANSAGTDLQYPDNASRNQTVTINDDDVTLTSSSTYTIANQTVTLDTTTFTQSNNAPKNSIDAIIVVQLGGTEKSVSGKQTIHAFPEPENIRLDPTTAVFNLYHPLLFDSQEMDLKFDFTTALDTGATAFSEISNDIWMDNVFNQGNPFSFTFTYPSNQEGAENASASVSPSTDLQVTSKTSVGAGGVKYGFRLPVLINGNYDGVLVNAAIKYESETRISNVGGLPTNQGGGVAVTVNKDDLTGSTRLNKIIIPDESTVIMSPTVQGRRDNPTFKFDTLESSQKFPTPTYDIAVTQESDSGEIDVYSRADIKESVLQSGFTTEVNDTDLAKTGVVPGGDMAIKVIRNESSIIPYTGGPTVKRDAKTFTFTEWQFRATPSITGVHRKSDGTELTITCSTGGHSSFGDDLLVAVLVIPYSSDGFDDNALHLEGAEVATFQLNLNLAPDGLTGTATVDVDPYGLGWRIPDYDDLKETDDSSRFVACIVLTLEDSNPVVKVQYQPQPSA